MATATKNLRTQVINRQRRRKSFVRRIFSPVKLVILAIIIVIFGSVFSFFYFKYSRMIDARLRGDIVVRTTGIYAAPRFVRTGQSTTLTAIRSHLDSIGYVESSKEADSKRGRYQVKGNSIDIFTSSDAVSDGTRLFPNLTITFGQGGRNISRITDFDGKRRLDTAPLEPEMLTAISNEKQRQKQKLVTFRDLPKEYINAVTAIEDRQFFEHSGINVRGLLRALVRDVSEGELQEGGSSITQQLVKNFFLTPERTFKRKLQEVMIALVLETKLSKEQIFQMYVNEVYMGQAGSYSINGVGEAASAYFDKDVVNLTLAEAAFLAGIIRGPSLYSPYRDLSRAKARRNQVLDSMMEAGSITRELGEQVKLVELKIQPKRSALNSDAPYFVDYIQGQLSSELSGRDVVQQSYRVYTTIDMDLQRVADKAVNDTLARLDSIFSRRKRNPIRPGTLQAALVALNAKTGDILAMVGGRDYAQSQLNRAVEANRQPGSVFKPFVYAAALETAYEGSADDVITPASLFLDAPEVFHYGRGQTYSPDNFGKTYSNQPVTLREALVHSLNVITVRIAEKVGYSTVSRMAGKVGLPRPQVLPAVALGTSEATPLEIAQSYSAFANAGQRVNVRGLVKLVDSGGRAVAEEKPQTRQVLRPQISWLMTNIMQDVLNRGTGARARSMGFTATAAGKTGTSRDGWFAGYTPNLVCVVWVGFDDNSELGLEGSKSALPIWAAFMKQALALRPELGGEGFPKPDSIVDAEIDPTTGLLASEQCPTAKTEYFIEGTQPEEQCEGHTSDSELPIPFEWPEGHEDVTDRPRRVLPPPVEKDSSDVRKPEKPRTP